MKNIITGKIYMKSGNVIPFAAEKFDMKNSLDQISSVDVVFIRWNNIDLVEFTSWSNVEAIVSHKAIEVDETATGFTYF